MKGLYRLVDRKPVPEPDVVIWAEWHATADLLVRETFVPDLGRVSTVFLGMDATLRKPPLLFETAIFWSNGTAMIQERYATWEEAEQGHERWARQLCQANN